MTVPTSRINRRNIAPQAEARPVELEAKLDAWIDGRPEPSRSEAIRRLLERALDRGD